MTERQLRPDRETPIRPAKIHTAPIVTIEKLATALYWIGRAAIRGQTLPPDQMKATLYLTEQAAEDALSNPDWIEREPPTAPEKTAA